MYSVYNKHAHIMYIFVHTRDDRSEVSMYYNHNNETKSIATQHTKPPSHITIHNHRCQSNEVFTVSVRIIFYFSFGHFRLVDRAGPTGGENPTSFGSFAKSGTDVSCALFLHGRIALTRYLVSGSERRW